jgi:hypothetical protein
MPLSPERKAELLQSSKEAASAFLEDTQHLREIVGNNDPSRGEIRRISGVLRRLLVERDIALIAAPRIGKILLQAPDNNPAYKAERKWPYLLYASGRANVLGGHVGTIFAFDTAMRPRGANPQMYLSADELHGTTELRLDGFLSQRVLCYRGTSVSRAAVIKYVANVASGIHSGAPKTSDELILAQMRSSAQLSVRGEGIHLDLFPNGIDIDEAEFKHSPDALDVVLIELLAAAAWLVDSPAVLQLEKVIREELA